MDIQPLYLLSSVFKRRSKKRSSSQLRRIPAHMLIFVLKGSGMLLINGAIQRIESFELYYLTPGMMLELSEQHEPIEYYAILFEPLVVKVKSRDRSVTESAEDSFLFPPGHIAIHNTEQVFRRCSSLYDSLKPSAERDEFSLRLTFETLLQSLQREIAGQQKAMSDPIDRSIEHMERNLGEKMILAGLAHMTNLTPETYSRLFKRKTGLLPLEYLTRLRIDEAKKLLLHEDSRVKEIVGQVGFRSEFYFSRTFHRYVGVAPSIYMKRSKLKIAAASSLGFGDVMKSLGVELTANVDLFWYPWLTEMLSTETWGAIKAVRNNKVRLIPNWFVMSWTPNGQHQIMDALLESL
ncbi:AraC family transcriptional regulator [Paenibacillaceae bacterium]|nr:AraC family transcriptional regulator [Paenibacillaceae bacterium]